ncbi:acyl-CoA desaturase [Streptomyces ficellus]|uniref:Acyl-CoA desaturase n=1 Tax=Streptomyces ficellus TaxID=1977088 RepID=A0ABT7ZC25_9ACTN|nr:acyl-CoA desaturase [Streptomyces ficellus]MDN3297060.1 acyl-CoA desaturase [Streptomyces ficellus]
MSTKTQDLAAVVEAANFPADGRDLQVSPTASFDDLLHKVRQAGLMDYRPGYFAVKIALNVVLSAAGWVAFALLGNSWWQLAVAVWIGLCFVQTGFIAHDTGHKQISRARKTQDVLGWIHMNVLLGVSFGWWVNHHNRHHSNPNNLDKDPDTVRRQVIFAPSEYARKAHTPFRRFVIRHQAVMFFVLLMQEAFRMHKAGFTAARAGLLRIPVMELGLLMVHFTAYLVAVFTVLDPGLGVVFILVNQAVFGIYLGAVFAPNHKGMAVHRDDVEVDWLHRQVLTSRNIYSSRFTDFMYGGLNYQIEHHLFPSMPRVNLRRARPLVREYCAAHGVPYHEVSQARSYLEVARHLREVSVSTRARISEVLREMERAKA